MAQVVGRLRASGHLSKAEARVFKRTAPYGCIFYGEEAVITPWEREKRLPKGKARTKVGRDVKRA